MDPVKAIILAGGKLEKCFKEWGEKAVNKAFIKIRSREDWMPAMPPPTTNTAPTFLSVI